MEKRLKELVAQIPGPDGFYKRGVQEDFENFTEELINKGFSEEHALEFLYNCYYSVSEEYGN